MAEDESRCNSRIWMGGRSVWTRWDGTVFVEKIGRFWYDNTKNTLRLETMVR